MRASGSNDDIDLGVVAALGTAAAGIFVEPSTRLLALGLHVVVLLMLLHEFAEQLAVFRLVPVMLDLAAALVALHEMLGASMTMVFFIMLCM
jgi:hypothetical protein